MSKEKKTILILAKYYLPGYKAGGPIRTIANFVAKLGGEFNLKLLCLDRDLGDTSRYLEVKNSTWTQVKNVRIFYLAPELSSFLYIYRILRSEPYEQLYLNSFFDFKFTFFPLLLRWLRLIPARRVIVAPRGEFSPGALSIKKTKKMFYLNLVKFLGIYKNVSWQASSEIEATLISNQFPSVLGKNFPNKIFVAPNIPDETAPNISSLAINTEDVLGNVKMVFLSRISRMKNLAGALSILKHVNANIDFDIYGPIEDEEYWSKCQSLIQELRENVKVRYLGSIQNSEVLDTLKNYDLFFLPTLGENYGHVIHEALRAGVPVLISDRTPWLNLMKEGVGWSFSLSDEYKFAESIEDLSRMSNNSLNQMKIRAQKYGLSVGEINDAVAKNREIFLQ
ncbi:glycosyltransferase [Undibacterium sp. WLHG33]|uniref:glycosyltransferase n=1 Tax=Undibacterium sp. WLHG33 TaxID=3412482 RepID=UPI003C306A89